MDKFDRQIALLKPDHTAPKLDERQFMNKLNAARRTQQLRRRILALLALTMLIVLVGMLSRNILEVIGLTLRYVTDLPAIFSDFYRAYASAISWPGMVSLGLSAVAAALLTRQRQDVTAAHSRNIYRYTVAFGVLALGFGSVGLFSGAQQAYAQQEALRRALNERGHLEVRINDQEFELNGAFMDLCRTPERYPFIPLDFGAADTLLVTAPSTPQELMDRAIILLEQEL